MKISNNTDNIIVDHLYAYGLSSSFCINHDGEFVKKEDEMKQGSDSKSEFLSRECINKDCICDSNPALYGRLDKTSNLHYSKVRVRDLIVLLSGTNRLMDVTSPQYKAACWILNDDPYFEDHHTYTKLKTNEKIVDRMIQHYILAVFYFSTAPKYWTRTYHFLSSRSECAWNEMEEFYENKAEYLLGVICDDNENVRSIIFSKFLMLLSM